MSATENTDAYTTSGVNVTVPYGAVEADTYLHIEEYGRDRLKTASDSIHGPVCDIYIGNAHQNVNKACKVSLPYTDDDDDGVVDGTAILVKDLKVYHYNAGTQKWTELSDSTVDTTTKNVWGTTESFSYFALAWSDPGDIVAADSTVQPMSSTNGGASGGGGCFIATSAYESIKGKAVKNFTGKYLIPVKRLKKLNSLRRFRDDVLLKKRTGRQFVRMYYTLGPVAAEAIRGREPLKKVVRSLLLPKEK